MSFYNSLTPESSATPPCPHFGSCGGCQLQDLTYAAQLSLKSERLRGLLAATGIAFPDIQIHASPPLAYRNRIRLTLAQIDGELRAGYIRGPESSAAEDKPAASLLPIGECPIAAPILWRAAEVFLALANEQPAAWVATADQLELFTDAEESRLNLTLYLRTQSRHVSPLGLAAFVALNDKLRHRAPELTSAGILLLPPTAAQRRSRRAEQPRLGPTWGKPGLVYSIGEINYWVPRGAFFQANRFLLPELIMLVTHQENEARSGSSAWDLYAGVGLFSRALAQKFSQVVAVEIAEPAATALASTKLPNLRAVKATTLDFLRANVIQRERPDLIVLDPPRTGAGPEVCGLLARIAAPTLIYVSCSPQTLPGDLAILAATGYAVAELHLLDLFPQTTHIETVAILRR